MTDEAAAGAHATLYGDATADLQLDGYTHAIRGTSDADARQKVLHLVVETAKGRDAPVLLSTRDRFGQGQLRVRPEGIVEAIGTFVPASPDDVLTRRGAAPAAPDASVVREAPPRPPAKAAARSPEDLLAEIEMPRGIRSVRTIVDDDEDEDAPKPARAPRVRGTRRAVAAAAREQTDGPTAEETASEVWSMLERAAAQGQLPEEPEGVAPGPAAAPAATVPPAEAPIAAAPPAPPAPTLRAAPLPPVAESPTTPAPPRPTGSRRVSAPMQSPQAVAPAVTRIPAPTAAVPAPPAPPAPANIAPPVTAPPAAPQPAPAPIAATPPAPPVDVQPAPATPAPATPAPAQPAPAASTRRSFIDESIPKPAALPPRAVPLPLRPPVPPANTGDRVSFLTSEPTVPTATRGWRGALARAGMRVSPSRVEREERHDVEVVSRHWTVPRTIAVVNGKGGANKTPTTALLAAVFARYGGSGVLAWDNNDARGTLGWRTDPANHEATARDLLGRADWLLSPDARSSDLSSYVHHQTADRYDVLRSNPLVLSGEHRIDPVEFDRLHAVASKYFRLIVIDSGNDEAAPRWRRMIDRADQLVIATTALGEHAEAGALLLEALSQRDERSKELADRAVVIVSQSEKGAGLGPARRIADAFSGMTRGAVAIPFDKALHSGRIRFEAMEPETQRAWLAAAALAGEDL